MKKEEPTPFVEGDGDGDNLAEEVDSKHNQVFLGPLLAIEVSRTRARRRGDE